MGMRKWQSVSYRNPLQKWTPPPFVYPCVAHEETALRRLKQTFSPLSLYSSLETEAAAQETTVSIEIPVPSGHIAFLENTAERCTSPQTKHSQEGMQVAKNWVQRVDTPDAMFQRLTEGYGVSLMFGERCHQYIRNSNNWRGINGVQLDLDVWYQHPDALKKKLEAEDRDADFIAERLDANEKLPLPVYSQSELFDRYPLLPRICSYLIPSASSLYEGRPFKARGVVLFPEPVTDMRVYRQFGDMLCEELDCIPQNVTKNPVAVGFGNTHNASQAYRNQRIDTAWISDQLQASAVNVIAAQRTRNREKKQKTDLKAHYAKSNVNGTGEGENISAFIDKCDALREMLRSGLLTQGRGNEYRWHESENDRSCEILGDGVIHIFSHSMQAASPAAELEPVNVHRFYLYQLSGLDLAKDADKARCREYLFSIGYGSDPKAYAKQQAKKGIRKPVKLQNVPKYDKVIETLHTARAFLKSVFEKGADFFAIRTDTGTGKTEKAITYAMTKEVAIPTLSGKLRDEIVSRATDKEMFAWGYRGITETEEADGYMPCIQSERFDLFRQKGFNPYKWICEFCPAYHECKDRGYLSQPDRAKTSQLLAIPFPTAFLDGRLRNWAKMYLPKDGLILHDDLPIGSLFIEYKLSGERLRRILKDWHGTVAAEWAEVVLTSFSTRDWAKMRLASAMLSDTEYNTVVQAFTRCKLPQTGAIVEPDTLIRSQLVDYSTTDAIAQLPTIDPEKFDTATILELFWGRYPRIEDAPFAYDPATETFTFTFLPKPYRAKKIRVGFASATMHKDLITRIFPDIEFYDANTTEWETGAELYQLRTNRNPRGTVLNAVEKYLPTGEKVWEWEGLNTTGEDYYGKVLDFIKANSNESHAVLSYKPVIDEKQHELDALGVKTAHFGNLAGLDEAFAGVKNFHILFCPFVKPFDVDFLCKQLFGNDETPLLRDANGNLERDAEGSYADERVQNVNKALVTGELLQAIGRARLNLYPNRVFLWTSLFIDAVTNRTETTRFDEVDWETANGDLEKLRDIVSKRENGDVKALAESTGQSERTAYRQTQEVQKGKKQKQKQQAFDWYAKGVTPAEISNRFGGKPTARTVFRWLEEQDF